MARPTRGVYVPDGGAAFHLPGRHNQRSHGDGNTGIGIRKGGVLVEGHDAPALRNREKALARLKANLDGPPDETEEEWFERASAERALEQYSENGYVVMNGALRSGEVETAAGEIRDMDRAFELFGSRTSGEVTVYRGVGANHPLRDEMEKPGVRLGEAGFLSTSARREVADKFSGKTWRSEGTVVSIEVPSGTRFLPGVSGDDEDELIFERGGQLEVLAPHPDGTPRMRLVPREGGRSG